ncbi:hypothetical protein [Paenibacillus sp. FSL M7-0420]|uniref:hypothetical protein n=1 Tax=Paenibacillus sp. FSL M7-0420 TaxID=2921609 RepID=UPI0030FA52DF
MEEKNLNYYDGVAAAINSLTESKKAILKLLEDKDHNKKFRKKLFEHVIEIDRDLAGYMQVMTKKKFQKKVADVLRSELEKRDILDEDNNNNTDSAPH